MKARFSHKMTEPDEVPARWRHPREEQGVTHEGFQVLGLVRSLKMVIRGEDVRDDWYRGGDSYTHLQLFELSGQSGESGGSSYPTVTKDDVETMRVVKISELEWVLQEIGLDFDEETEMDVVDEMGFVDMDVLLSECDDLGRRLLDRDEVREVTPTTTDTLD